MHQFTQSSTSFYETIKLRTFNENIFLSFRSNEDTQETKSIRLTNEVMQSIEITYHALVEITHHFRLISN